MDARGRRGGAVVRRTFIRGVASRRTVPYVSTRVYRARVAAEMVIICINRGLMAKWMHVAAFIGLNSKNRSQSTLEMESQHYRRQGPDLGFGR